MSRNKKKRTKKFNPSKSWNNTQSGKTPQSTIDKVAKVINEKLFILTSSGQIDVNLTNIDKLGLVPNGQKELERQLSQQKARFDSLYVFFSNINGENVVECKTSKSPNLTMEELGIFQTNHLKKETALLDEEMRRNLVGYGIASCSNKVFCCNNDQATLIEQLRRLEADNLESNQINLKKKGNDDIHFLDVLEMRDIKPQTPPSGDGAPSKTTGLELVLARMN